MKERKAAEEGEKDVKQRERWSYERNGITSSMERGKRGEGERGEALSRRGEPIILSIGSMDLK